MPRTMDSSKELFNEQVAKLQEGHFLVLLWAARAEDRKVKYNLTNGFDDLKFHGITRTKQSAVAVIEALAALCFIQLRGEGTRRNIYITPHGAKALETLVLDNRYHQRHSAFLEGSPT